MSRTATTAICEYCHQPYSLPQCKVGKQRYCSQSCRAKGSPPPGIPQPKEKIAKTCQYCGKEFFVHQYRADTAKYCSRSCQRRSHPTYNRTPDAIRAEIIIAYRAGANSPQLATQYNCAITTVCQILKQAGVKCRPQMGGSLHTPKARERQRQNMPRGKDHPNHKEVPIGEIVTKYLAGVSTPKIASDYGVSAIFVARRLEAAGIERRRPGYPHWCTCQDGHVAQSHLEQAIDDWLSGCGIAHELHPLCPWPGKNRADFLVNGTYIEVWGLEGNKRYDANRLKKLAKYREHNAPLIQIFPHHILDGDLSTVLQTLL
ncbi:MAG: hypothetical protein ABFD92_21140 [Planctomycetaceae bacterium]